ncbi:hypothetical protein [Aquidulcibacter sp.]|uniref:hypothetical protein n=1 Tax=Aquidulcibacter sp. TaxID=2052990 RepID=UPI0025B94FAC|nr:hypothetical protein [Aquidulcibacter sp.]MCA3697038.1 hypothetical protein [Aquidulcibacter sp.]
MANWVSRALADIETQTESVSGVAALRAAMMQDGVIAQAEARTLIAIHRAGKRPSGEAGWADLFVEAMTDYYALTREVPHYREDELTPNWCHAIKRTLDALTFDALPDVPAEPTYNERLAALGVTEADAQVLIDAFAADGMVLDATELRVLTALFARANVYPANLRNFAWRAVQASVLADNTIQAHEVSLIRAIVIGPASLAGIAVDRVEADLLCALDQAVSDAQKDPSWANLFAQGIGNHLLFAGGTPGRLDADERTWLNEKLSHGPTAATKALEAFLAAEISSNA